MPDETIPVRAAASMIRPQLGCRLLFSYTDDMAEAVIRERVPDPVFVTTAYIPSRRWFINRDGVASITPARRSTVHGVIWEVTDTGICGLQLQLGVPRLYDRYGVLARDPTGKPILAEYFAPMERALGRAHPDYLGVILEVARRWKLPSTFMDEVREFDLDCP